MCWTDEPLAEHVDEVSSPDHCARLRVEAIDGAVGPGCVEPPVGKRWRRPRTNAADGLHEPRLILMLPNLLAGCRVVGRDNFVVATLLLRKDSVADNTGETRALTPLRQT